MKLEAIYKHISAELETVERRLLEFSRSENKAISEAVYEILSAGGKRLRPALVLMAAKACDYTGERAIRLAAAIPAATATPCVIDLR